MTKAVHEAKVNLSWVNPNPEYIEALREFIARILKPGSGGRPNTFLEQFEQFAALVAYFGAFNSLSQTLLKIAAPGIPDTYQGTELFDFSLVDPDNRRPVDFGLRHKCLDQLRRRAGEVNAAQLGSELLEKYADGGVKMWTLTQALNFRELPGKLLRQSAPAEAPAPVAVGAARRVHAAIAVQAKHILQRDDGQISHRIVRRANEAPVDPILALTEINPSLLLLVSVRSRIPPTHRSVIIVGAGVYNGVVIKAVRQVNVRARIAKPKLQNAHAGNIEPLAKSVHVRRDHAEVFGHKRQVAKSIS